MSAGIFATLFHTYRWQIDKFSRVSGDKRFDFICKYKLNERIELEGLDLSRWPPDPRLDVLLFTLAHFPETDSEHALAVLRAKTPEIIAAAESGKRPSAVLEMVERYAMILIEKKKDAAAATVFELLSASAGIMVAYYEAKLLEYEVRLKAARERDNRPFMEQVDNYDQEKDLDSTQTLLFYRGDVLGNKGAWEEHWVRAEFWRASARHNLSMKDKTNAEVKRAGAEAIKDFLTLHKRVFGDRYNSFSQHAETMSRLLQEEY